MKKVFSFDELKDLVDKVINEVIAFYKNRIDYNKIVYTDWSAKDVLGHIVMWHESFARNVIDIVNDRKPNPLKGSLTEVNENGVIENRKDTIDQLIDRLKRANNEVIENIGNKSIDLIPYKKGSRYYTRDEHLEIVYRHIKGHLEDMKKAYKL